MMRRFRMLLPPGWAVILAVFLYVTFSLPEIIFALNFGMPRQGNYGRALISGFLAIAFGCWRVVAFHPFYRSDYRLWLESTPWTRKKPLPVGPIRLVWEDVAIFAAIWVPSIIERDLPPLALPILFLSGYSLPLALSLIDTGSWVCGYAILYGLGGNIFFYNDLTIVAELTAGLYLIGQIGLWRSLGRFPWEGVLFKTAAEAIKVKKVQHPNTLGWPFDILGPKAGEPLKAMLSARDAILLSVLLGWWVAAIAKNISQPAERMPLYSMVSFYCIGFALIRRLTIYLNGYAAPIGIWGRISTFRWIIPGYDKVFIAPILIAVSAWVVPFELTRLGISDLVAVPLGISLALIVCALSGPDLRLWRLTGNHRIGPNALPNAAKIDSVKLG